MSLILHVVDAFTNRPFAGNPAAVCLLPTPPDAAWVQRVAREMNSSETAFLQRQRDAFALRWFTPAAEVVLHRVGCASNPRVWPFTYEVICGVDGFMRRAYDHLISG